MSLHDERHPLANHRRELDLDAPTHHNIQSRPWEHPEDSRSIRLEQIAEDIRIAEAEALHQSARAVALRAEYDRVKAWGPDPAPLPVVDGRCFDAGSADTAEEWRGPSGRRSA